MYEDMTNHNEDELIARLSEFDLTALTHVYDLYSDAIYRYGFRLLGNEDQAEECVSETFNRLLESLHKGRGPKTSVRPYLYRIAHNWITDQFRRTTPTEPLPIEAASPAQSPEQTTMNNLAGQELRRNLKSLPSAQRQALVLKYLEDMDNKEIALAMNRPVGAVKALQNRGLKNLKNRLKVKP